MANVNIAMRKISTIKPRVSSEIPAPRSGHRCVADNRNLYLFGGFSPFHDESIFRELWRYNISARTWKRLSPTGSFPNEVCSSCVLLDKGCILIYGGSGIPFGQSNSNKLHVYVINENKLIQVDAVVSNYDDRYQPDDSDDENFVDLDERIRNYRPPDRPWPGYGQSMVLSPDNELYVFAGTAGLPFFNTLSRFSFTTRQWEHIPHPETLHIKPRYRHEAITYGDKFYVMGGAMVRRYVCNLKGVPSFCFSSKMWEVCKCNPCETHGFPKKRYCHGCVLFQDKVYICGGYDGVTIFDDIWTLDMLTFKWTKLPMVLPYPVYFHSTAITPSGCMLTFGGMKSLDPDNDPRSNDLHCLWLTIPPLLDLSLQAVYSCISDIDSISNEELFKIGIPDHLLPSLNCEAVNHLKISETDIQVLCNPES